MRETKRINVRMYEIMPLWRSPWSREEIVTVVAKAVNKIFRPSGSEWECERSGPLSTVCNDHARKTVSNAPKTITSAVDKRQYGHCGLLSKSKTDAAPVNHV